MATETRIFYVNQQGEQDLFIAHSEKSAQDFTTWIESVQPGSILSEQSRQIEVKTPAQILSSPLVRSYNNV